MGLIAVVELLPGALDGQLQRDAGVSHFEYMVISMLSEAPDRTLRMTTLAARTNSTLPRLSHVVTRLVARGYVERVPCPGDRTRDERPPDRDGWAQIQQLSTGHVAPIDLLVIDPLSAGQFDQHGTSRLRFRAGWIRWAFPASHLVGVWRCDLPKGSGFTT